MDTEVEKKTWALCPECNGRVGTVDHLVAGDAAGPWFCDDCGRGWWLDVTVTGIEHRPHAYVQQKTKVVLVLPPQKSEVRLTLNGFSIIQRGEDIDGDEYLYNEHTCPTNWLRDVVTVSFEGNDDPHGLFRWESTVKTSTDERRAERASED